MERTSWRRRARAFVPALLLLFALAGWMLPAAPGPAAEADAVLEAGEGGPCPTVPAGQKLIALQHKFFAMAILCPNRHFFGAAYQRIFSRTG